MSSRARKAAIDDDEWERVRPIIHQLYLVDGKTQRDTLKILSEYHNLDPSKAQLERKLKQWRMVRNMTGPEWKYVDRVIRQRQSHGKGSQLYLAGIPLRPAAIEKARSRHCYETAIARIMPMLEPSHPEELPLIVRTPSPLGHRYMDYLEDIPWLQSLNFFKGFTLRVPRSIRGAGNSLQFLGTGLLDIVPNHFRRVLTHTTRLQGAYQALCLIMPSQPQEDHISRAEAILNHSELSNPEALETIFFLLSNGFLDDWSSESRVKSLQMIDDLFELLHISNGWALITSRPFSELSLSLQAILNRLFKEAVERFDIKASRYLLQAGVNSNMYWSPTVMRLEYGVVLTITPFEYAALLYNMDMTALLAEYGANTELSSLEGVAAVIKSSSRSNATRMTLPWIDFILSHCVCHADCESYVCEILHSAETLGITPVTEALIKYFQTRVATAAIISQLIITAIKTESRLLSVLLSQYPEHTDVMSPYGETPLMAAAGKGDLAVCKQLLRLGASIESKFDGPACFNTATPLQCAACFADARTVRYLIDSGAQVDFYHPHDALHFRSVGGLSHELYSTSAGHYLLLQSLGRTALQAALIGGNEDTAKLLLAEGAKIFGGELAISIRKRLPKLISHICSRQASVEDNVILPGLLTSTLEAAIISGNYDLAQHELNTNPSSITPEALYAAIWFADLKSTPDLAFVRTILQKCPEFQYSTTHWVGTAMSLAAKLGSLEIVKSMLSYGLRPKFCLSAYQTEQVTSYLQPLFDSGNYRTEKVYLEWLFTMRVPRRNDKYTWPMLDDAACRGRHDYLNLLLSHGYKPTVSCAVRAARLATSTSVFILRHLHRLGIRMTPYVLIGSILKSDTASIEWLLSLGLDLNEEVEPIGHMHDGLLGRTAVQAAAQRGDLALLDKLVSLGADINAPAYYRHGVTALQVAAIQGYFEIVRRLLVLGADPNAAGAELSGRTALEGAAEHGRLDIVQLLLNSGVETNGPGRRQFIRAIAFAKYEGHAAVATLLRSQRRWTSADQEILDEDRLLHRDQTSQKEADHQSASLDQNVEDRKEPQLDAACCDPRQPFEEPIPSSTYEPLESFGQADLGRRTGFVTEHDDPNHSDEGYIELEVESFRVNYGEGAELVDASGAQEILGEIENDFRPSGIFDQVKEDLELTGEGDRIWAEAYSAFSMELLC